MYVVVHNRDRIWMPYNFRPCRHDPTVNAYSLPGVSWIVLCPRISSRNPTVGKRDADYVGVQGASIETVAKVISVTILHELMHLIYPESSEFNILCLSLFYSIDKTNIYYPFSGSRR